MREKSEWEKSEWEKRVWEQSYYKCSCMFWCLGMFSWMLLNIHHTYRSTLHSIQLLAVANSMDICKYGIELVLAPAIADLKTLATDVTILYLLVVLHSCWLLLSGLGDWQALPFLCTITKRLAWFNSTCQRTECN